MIMPDVGFTGTRLGMTGAQKMTLGKLLADIRPAFSGPAWFHHGLCVGADAEAHQIARDMNYLIEGHPPTNQRLMAKLEGFAKMNEPLPYLQRDGRIVQACTELLACPTTPVTAEVATTGGGGTWSTIRYAQRLGRKVTIILPNGSTEVYPAREPSP